MEEVRVRLRLPYYSSQRGWVALGERPPYRFLRPARSERSASGRTGWDEYEVTAVPEAVVTVQEPYRPRRQFLVSELAAYNPYQ